MFTRDSGSIFVLVKVSNPLYVFLNNGMHLHKFRLLLELVEQKRRSFTKLRIDGWRVQKGPVNKKK